MIEAEMNEPMSAAKGAIETEAAAVGLAIPWMLILQIVMELFSGCGEDPTPEEMKQRAASPGLFTRLRGYRIARRHLGWNENRRTVEAALNVGFKAVGQMETPQLAKLADAAKQLAGE